MKENIINASDINTEMGRINNKVFSLDDPKVREFAGRLAGPISYSDFNGKKLELVSWKLHEHDLNGKHSGVLFSLDAYDKNGRKVFSTGRRSLDGVDNIYTGKCNPGMKDIDILDLSWYRDTKSHGTAKMWLYVYDSRGIEYLIAAYDKHQTAFKAHPTRHERFKLGTHHSGLRSYILSICM